MDDRRYIASWVDLCHDTHLEEITGMSEEGVIDALRHWFRKGAQEGWIAFQVCTENPNSPDREARE